MVVFVAVEFLEHVHVVVVLRRHKQLLAVATHKHAAYSHMASDVDVDVAHIRVGVCFFRRAVGKHLLHGG